MDASNTGTAEKKSSDGGGDIVINVSGEEASKVSSKPSPESEKAVPIKKNSSPENSKPPRPSSLTQRKSFANSVYSKPKSRFEEPSCNVDTNDHPEGEVKDQVGSNISLKRDPSNNKSNMNVESTTPLSPRKEDDEDKKISKKVKSYIDKFRKISTLVWIEAAFFVAVLSALIASLTIDVLRNHNLWGLQVWKWCVLMMVIFDGMLVTKCFMLLIEKNIRLVRKAFHFVHGLKSTVQVFIWFSLVLVVWEVLFNHDLVKRSSTRRKILNHITKTLISLLIGAFFWLVKILLFEIVVAYFNVVNFFETIRSSIFHQYVLRTLSGRPLAERNILEASTCIFTLGSKDKNGDVKEETKIDMEELHEMEAEKVSAWRMRVFVETLRTSDLSTSDTLNEKGKITSEKEALTAAGKVFKNVASDRDYIIEDDLRRFMNTKDVEHLIPLIEGGATTSQITEKSFTEWVAKVYNSHKALAHSLNDTKTGVKMLNKLVTTMLFLITGVMWLLILEVATIKILLFFSSQLVALAFIIGSTCKSLFESIVFVFITHPYDVGDRCVIDGLPMRVEEINLLTTVFTKLNYERVYYPNTVLATKPISNYFRSSNMGETIEFSIAFSTPDTKISDLRERIAKYLEKNSQHWTDKHAVVVNEIENMNKLKMALYSNHTITFQEYTERLNRRTDLCLAIKKILENLEIDYNLLPQEVHLFDKTKHVKPTVV